MAKDIFTLGPVLSFRGIRADDTWQVTALIGIALGSALPVLQVEGRDCTAPIEVYASKKERFLRYDVSVKLTEQERKIVFGLNGGPNWAFSVPGKGYAPRMAYVSCNGFSDSGGMRKLVRPENAVWADLLGNHDKTLRPSTFMLDKEQIWHEGRIHDKDLQRFHLLLMGGDQIYFDSIWEDIKPLKRWIAMARDEQLKFKISKSLEREIEDYYMRLYSQRWLPESRRNWGQGHNLDCADAMARIPTIMMWDDHDIFDGWGSYSPQMQNSEVFKTLFRYARQAFWVFQMQHPLSELPQLKPVDRPNLSPSDPQYEPIDWAAYKRQDALALPLLDKQPGFSFSYHIGPVSLAVLDLRTERSRTQVLGSYTWAALQIWLATLKDGVPAHPGDKCQHLLVLSSVPVAHPKLSLVEGLLDTFGQDHVLDSNADDLKDHWSHDDHEGERKRLLETLANIAGQKMLRVSIASGDVHVAAWGSAYRRDIPATSNWAQIQQFTSSAIVHPSLMKLHEKAFAGLLNMAAKHVQSIDVQFSVEMMLFPGHNKYVMPARNWLAFELDMGRGDESGCKLWATWRCETETGFSNHLQAVTPAQQGFVEVKRAS